MSDFTYGYLASALVHLVIFWFLLRSCSSAWRRLLNRSLTLSKQMLSRIEYLEGRLKSRQDQDPADWWKGG